MTRGATGDADGGGLTAGCRATVAEWTAPKRCPACGIEARRSFRLSQDTRLLRCPRCRMGWWNWSAQEGLDPATFYDRDYFQSAEAAKGYDDYRALEAGARMTAGARLRRLAELTRGKRGAMRGRMLDVGCGTGCFLEEARRAGWDAAGIEVSAFAAARARERGLSVECGPIEEARPAAAFDCVTLWDVIEHLRDPACVLRKLGRSVRAGGVLALSTGDVTSLCARLSGARWHLFNLPEHLHFFSPRALQTLLRAAGFRVRRIVREVNWVPVAYLFERLRKSTPLRRTTPRRGTHERESAAARFPRLVVPATLFDVLGVYATRVG